MGAAQAAAARKSAGARRAVPEIPRRRGGPGRRREEDSRRIARSLEVFIPLHTGRTDSAVSRSPPSCLLGRSASRTLLVPDADELVPAGGAARRPEDRLLAALLPIGPAVGEHHRLAA